MASLQAPPRPRDQDELEALIEEARRRARRRRIRYATLAAGVVLIAAGTGIWLSTRGGSTPSVNNGASAVAADCRATQLRPRIPGPQEATGFLFGGVWIENVRGPSCVLNGRLRFAISQPGGQPLEPIRGNPVSIPVHTYLPAGEMRVWAWRWGNWCHGERDAVLTSSVAGHQASLRIQPTSCEAPGASSGLQRIGLPRSERVGPIRRVNLTP
jgi:hypothetical protein